jgi:hypothetical protein
MAGARMHASARISREEYGHLPPNRVAYLHHSTLPPKPAPPFPSFELLVQESFLTDEQVSEAMFSGRWSFTATGHLWPLCRHVAFLVRELVRCE